MQQKRRLAHASWRLLLQRLRRRVIKMGTFWATAWVTAIAEVMAILLAWALIRMMAYSADAARAVMTAASTLPLMIAPIVGGTIVLLLEDLEAARTALEELSTRDGLTSLFNRTYFMDRLRREMAQSVRHNTPMSLLIVDTDDFKRINDRFGHTAGDQVLQSLAHTFTLLLREGDVLARYGGEEFVLLLPTTPDDGAIQVAEKLRSAMEAMRVTLVDVDEPVRITVSVGVSGRRGLDDTADAVFTRADRALYRAKLAGKNRWVFDGMTIPVPLAESDPEEIMDVENPGGLACV